MTSRRDFVKVGLVAGTALSIPALVRAQSVPAASRTVRMVLAYPLVSYDPVFTTSNKTQDHGFAIYDHALLAGRQGSATAADGRYDLLLRHHRPDDHCPRSPFHWPLSLQVFAFPEVRCDTGAFCTFQPPPRSDAADHVRALGGSAESDYFCGDQRRVLQQGRESKSASEREGDYCVR